MQESPCLYNFGVWDLTLSRRWTYREFGTRVRKLAGAFSNAGVHKGDRVAVLMLNCHRYLELYAACPYANGNRVSGRYHRLDHNRVAACRGQWRSLLPGAEWLQRRK